MTRLDAIKGMREALEALSSEWCDCAGVGDGHACPTVAGFKALRDLRASEPLESDTELRDAITVEMTGLRPTDSIVAAFLRLLDEKLKGAPKLNSKPGDDQ